MYNIVRQLSSLFFSFSNYSFDIFSNILSSAFSLREYGNLNGTLSSFAFLIATLTGLFVLINNGVNYAYHISRAFGHEGGYTVGLLFAELIFIMILGFGKSEYQGNEE